MILGHFLVLFSKFHKLFFSGVPKYYIWLESSIQYLSDGIMYMDVPSINNWLDFLWQCDTEMITIAEGVS